MDSAKNMAYRQLSSVVNPSISTNFEPPTIINGSQFNRTTLSDNFQKQEQFFERIATLSTSEQKSYGYSVSDLINYCTYMGERCDLSKAFNSPFFGTIDIDMNERFVLIPRSFVLIDELFVHVLSQLLK
ncbi:hypothetical protein HELRODRAFT_160534 [Helobdella robusta]|uniref:Uncharacterized protein n=1 Tax=Helobdella robusta TaxID=6412 RepID=T1EQD5_HELRO|nr:hypothetical protein HELRODRAFT_160534 [Helobdella robusta]ESO06367.1 hypothetical protein HELRODRAFT_160534 [Helobdella robusta]